ncbi:unnamed protein product [Rhizophagus irregularis]|nr:unnamed protein product [Rhizophagus irregularis]
MWVVWVGSAGGLGVWECGLGEGVGVGVGVWALFSFRLSLGLPSLCLGSLCLGLLFIRSPFRPFSFSSLFGFTFSLSSSSLY